MICTQILHMNGKSYTEKVILILSFLNFRPFRNITPYILNYENKIENIKYYQLLYC
jgi:hypothetical protein